MQSYSATIIRSRMVSFVPHDLLTPKGVIKVLYCETLSLFFSGYALVATFVLKFWLSALTSISDISNFQMWV